MSHNFPLDNVVQSHYILTHERTHQLSVKWNRSDPAGSPLLSIGVEAIGSDGAGASRTGKEAWRAGITPRKTEARPPGGGTPDERYHNSPIGDEIMAATQNTPVVNALPASIKSANVRKLTRFSKVTGYSLSDVLDRAVDMFMVIEAPVYLAEAKQTQRRKN
jgi:hypothetical protein